jgi:hypothetical protein
MPHEIGPVTGEMDDATAALVFDRLTTSVDGVLDLWRYADAATPDLPVRFALGTSTVCALQTGVTSHPRRMKSRYGRILAVGRLAEPYCVWSR